MHPIVYYILFFLAIGAVGMAIANRKAIPAVRKQRWLKYFTYIIFTSIVVLSIFYDCFHWVAAVIVTAALAELIRVNYKNKSASRRKQFLSFLVFIPVATGFVFYSFAFHYSFFLFIYLQVLVFDGFCQITGQLFGKHLLAPSVSPTKTVEGLIGGWLCCIGAALLGADWVQLSLPNAAMFGLFTGLISFTGDMLASWYKRMVQVKDYSNWLPGQGGFLDRFDSFLLTGAVYFLLHIAIFKDYFERFTI